MAESIEWLRLFIIDYQSIEYLIIFLAAMFGGEIVLFLVGFLIAQNFFSSFLIVPIIFLGAFLPNIFWFFLAKTKLIDKTATSRHGSVTFAVITEAIHRASKGNHFLAFIIIKFLVGTPVLLVTYIHKTQLSFKKFMYYQSTSLALSIFIIAFIGFTAGKGYAYVSEISENIYTSIGFILFFVFILLVFQVWFEKFFTKKNIDK